MGEHKQVYRIAVLAMMVALCHVGRIMFQFLPNVQPVTVIVLLITLSFGVKDGLIVGVLSIIVSNLTLGMGIWTIAQVASYAVLVLLTGLFIPFQKKDWFDSVFVVYVGLSGYLYGLIISVIQAPFFGIHKLWPYYLAGIPFDSLHAIGNVGFYLILTPVLLPLIERTAKKIKS